MFAPAASVSPIPARFNPEFAQAVADGLTRKPQKTLSASWLYDEVGSALFEVITVLPEYGLTRADGQLLARASGEIIREACHPRLVIELGSGTGMKTRHVLAAAARFGAVEYRPIDISNAALDNCTKALEAMERVRIEPIEGSYIEGVEEAVRGRGLGQRALVLFLGSTIGNFGRAEAASFLRRIREIMLPGDHLLLGADLVKARDKLLAAYDDPIGVTAAFNLNLLARINRDLDGRFEIANFAHAARYNERHSRIEMHLRSRVKQEVWIGALDLHISFRAGETIWTESSHKFRPEEILRMGERAGWRDVRQWVDGDWGFAETLFRIPGSK